MFKELLAVFSGDSPMKTITDDFSRMLELAGKLVLRAGRVYWEPGHQPEEREALYKQDVEVNRLQRVIREKITAHLAVQGPHDAPYSLLMMSLVKDVERIGDYAKNLIDMADIVAELLPDDPLVRELADIRVAVEKLVSEAAQAFLESDQKRAEQLVREGRRVSKRCDELVLDVARSDYDAALAVKTSMGARFYKRIEGHYLNILSGVIMPLHKLDYFDEDFLEDLQNGG